MTRKKKNGEVRQGGKERMKNERYVKKKKRN